MTIKYATRSHVGGGKMKGYHEGKIKRQWARELSVETVRNRRHRERPRRRPFRRCDKDVEKKSG